MGGWRPPWEGIGVDDSTGSAVLAAVAEEVRRLWDEVTQRTDLDLEGLEGLVRDGVLAIGARMLQAGVVARGTGQSGPRHPCACGSAADFEGYRTKGVQTVVGWLVLRRAYYACPACGHGHCPLDTALGLSRDSLSPGVRRLAGRLGALLPFAEAARTLQDTARVQLSASTMRTVTEAIGRQREQDLAVEIATAWTVGLPAVPEAPERLYVAMDGVRILSTDGTGREVKVGVVVPVRRSTGGECRERASYVAGLEPAARFGQRLALEAHQRGLEGAGAIAVLGDGAEWIWHLAAEHYPQATQIVDWFHASERIWELGRALWGAETAETTTWVAGQLARLAQGAAVTLAREWQHLPCRGEAAALRDAQVTYFTNQASRMAYDRYRAQGWDIGSGMVEAACKHVIGAREKGPGMRWSEAGAQHVAAVRVLLFNDRWATYTLAA
jgi:hypothetical protein